MAGGIISMHPDKERRARGLGGSARGFRQAQGRRSMGATLFHDTRHTCASMLLAQVVQPRVVMETLDHTQIGLTLNTYVHVIPELQRDTADRMEEPSIADGGREPDPVAVNVAVNEG